MTWTKSTFPKLNIANERNKVYKHGTVLSHYHYSFDPRIGLAKCAMRRIPCLCIHCLDTLDKQWISEECAEDQPCYAPVLNCKYNQTLGHYNNWIIIPFQVSENTYDDEIEGIYKSILTSIADAMGMLRKESTYAAVNANDQRTDGLYIVKLLSTVYTLQHDEIVDKETLKAGFLVTDAECMSLAMKESLRYVKSGLKPVKVNMNKVLVSNIDVDIVTCTSELDYSMSTMTQEDVIQQEPFCWITT